MIWSEKGLKDSFELGKWFPSKVLLLGEYSVVLGSSAIALPYHRFKARLAIPDLDRTPEQIDSNNQFGRFIQQVQEIEPLPFLDYKEMVQDSEAGIYLDSSIPTGYGLGSSGALVAAVFAKYGNIGSTRNLEKLKGEMAHIESVFHGKSSGIDPLVCYLNKTVHGFEGKISIVKELDHKVLSKLILVDTGIPRETASLVNLFKSKLESGSYNKQISEELVPLVDEAIEQLLSKKASRIGQYFAKISDMQLSLFPEMIVEKLRNVWLQGLKSGDYCLKLCGAGGGGFYLAYSDLHLPDLELKFNNSGFNTYRLSSETER